jgi:hypothetical protein
MAILRRNAGWLGTIGGLALMAAVVWWVFTPATSSNAMLTAVAYWPSVPELTAVQAGQIERLRRDSGLDDDALACLDLSDDELDVVFTDLREWFDANATALANKLDAVATARNAVNAIRSQFDMGTEEDAQNLESAVANLAAAKSEYEALLVAAREDALESVSAGKAAIVTRMKANHAVAMPFRFLELSDEQRDQLHVAQGRHFRIIGTLPADLDQTDAHDQHQQALETALGAEAIAELSDLAEFRAESARRLVAAIQRNLPVQDDGYPPVEG